MTGMFILYVIKNSENIMKIGRLEEMIGRVVCGDSRTVLAQLPDGCIQMAMTSPPYY